MKKELLKFHRKALQETLDVLHGWEKPADQWVSDETRKDRIERLTERIEFHQRAIKYLSK